MDLALCMYVHSYVGRFTSDSSRLGLDDVSLESITSFYYLPSYTYADTLSVPDQLTLSLLTSIQGASEAQPGHKNRKALSPKKAM
jgi:hypothetical protein